MATVFGEANVTVYLISEGRIVIKVREFISLVFFLNYRKTKPYFSLLFFEVCSFGRFGQHCEHDCSGYFDDANRKSWWKCKIDVLNVIEDCEDIWECWDKLYSCPEGSIGKNCEVPCPIGTFGALCLRKCNCNEKNTLECDKGTGQCMCKERFYGTHCENECIGKLTCGYGNYCTCEKLEHVLDEIERKFAENEERFEKSKKKSDSQLWKKILRRLDKEFEDQKREDEANRFLDSRIILLTVLIAFNGLASFIAFIVYRFKYKKLRQSQVVHVSAQHMRK